VCCFTTKRFAGLKKSKTKSISYTSVPFVDYTPHKPAFGQQLFRFVLSAQSWVASLLSRSLGIQPLETLLPQTSLKVHRP
jgi:hypothetical protein